MITLITNDPSCYIVTATKELVDALLELNTHNRKMRQYYAEQMSDEMKANQWFLTNQGIGVTRSGWLCDGQNRLEAMRLAGYPPLQILIVTGLEDEAQVVVDTHAKRKQADIMTLVLNHTVSGRVVAAVNVLLMVSEGKNGFTMSVNGRPSNFEMSSFISDNSELLNHLMPHAGTLRAPVVAALIKFGQDYSAEDAAEFSDQIRLGIGLLQSSPAYRLRQWLDKNKGGGQVTQTAAYAAAVTACIAFARDTPLSFLRPSSSWSNLPTKRKDSRTSLRARV